MGGDADADFTARRPRGRAVRSQDRALCRADAAGNRASCAFSRGSGSGRTVLRLCGGRGTNGRARARRARGLLVLPGVFADTHRPDIIVLAARYRLAAVYPTREFVASAGMMAHEC